MVGRGIMSYLLNLAGFQRYNKNGYAGAGAPPEWHVFINFLSKAKSKFRRVQQSKPQGNRRINYEDTIYHSARCHLCCVHGLSVPERNHSRNITKRPTRWAKPTLRARNERCRYDLRSFFVRG